MQVLKFGGSSVANATAISRVLDIIDAAVSKDKVILVSSAISGCTDSLIALGSGAQDKDTVWNALLKKHEAIATRLFTGDERDRVVETLRMLFDELYQAEGADCQTFGELFSTRILAEKLSCDGLKTLWIDSRDLVRTKGGVVDEDLTYSNIRSVVESHPEVDVFVAPGFIARDENGHVCTLGRGGSDYSAALYAAALQAQTLQIWTDVPGIMTTNPKDVASARTIPVISYEAAFCLADHGAKVLYAPTVGPAMKSNIAIAILNTFQPEAEGTIIKALPKKGKGNWLGIACSKDAQTARLCLVADGLVGQARLDEVLSRLSKASIPVSDARLEGDDHALICVPAEDAKEALRVIHHDFFDTEGMIDIWLAGYGNVGHSLLNIIEKTGARVNVKLISQHESDNEAFFAQMLQHGAPNAVFVDCTDSESIYKWYVPALEAGLNIVSSNRRALSVPYAEYAEMKRAARRNHRFLRYEASVGTALPILESITMSANSADEILSIEAVVSCTLNYILTCGLPFEQALEKAQEIGLTEKDPRNDLYGRDALRKLLILAREAGVPLEAEDVEIQPVDGSKASSDQRFVASLCKDNTHPKGYRASICLRKVDSSHPAWNLKGTDNAIVIRSAFHPTPLVIQGAGEGAKMAASAVLNDILR